MSTLTLIWIALPFFVGFSIYLVPKLDRYLALGVVLLSAGYTLPLFLAPSPLTLKLLDNFGVTLVADQLSGYFILTNALVSAAVILYCWHTDKTAFFYTQATILHGSINAVFISADFISLYVALEVIGLAVFLLIAYPRSDRSIWAALRYMFVSNTAMLFYLVGAVLVYQANHSFSFAALSDVSQIPTQALALIFLGLLSKGGIFISGLWSPLTNSESETQVSALLSGIVEKAGVFPLVRFALMFDEIDPIVRIFGVGTALFGVVYAIFDQDTKRTLAFSTISQLGWILAAPTVGGFYALAHGLAKSALFLIVGNLPSRNFKELKGKPINTGLWIAMTLASLSISGFPLFVGFGSKMLTMQHLMPWQVIAMNVAAVGTVIVYAKFVVLPHGQAKGVRLSFWIPILLLLGAVIGASGMYLEGYTLANITKALAIIAVGWLAYFLIFQRVVLKLPRVLEQLEHLLGVIGVMGLTLLVLFKMVLA